MSLLMDALKKAEEEKKKAAKRLEQVETTARNEESLEEDSGKISDSVESEPFTETVKLSLEPIAPKPNDEPILTSEPAVAEAIELESEEPKELEINFEDETSEISIDDLGFSEDLTMENSISEEDVPAETFEQTQQAIDLNDTTVIEGLSSENTSAPFDDTFHGVLFEEDEEHTDVYEETLPGVSADQLVKDIGGGDFQPTPVAAQTVFSAGNTKTKNNSSWGVFFVLAILALGSFAVFYYFTITPVARKLPSPVVARGIESLPAQNRTVSKIKKTDVVSGTIISPKVDDDAINAAKEFLASEEKIVAEENRKPEGELDEVPVQAESLSSDESEPDPVGVEVVDSENSTQEIKDVASVPISGEKLVVEENVSLDNPPKSVASSNPEMLKISKNKTVSKQNAMVAEAFKAYQAGDFESAEKLYKNALKDDPENRDIHLGLAAVAINKGEYESAYKHYLILLESNPGDAFVLSSLVSLSRSSDLVKDESIIKTLIQKEGKVPYLYFALGNIYAKQLRWTEAQQAFFNAYTLDSTNSDYVLNLAISLDKIGQYATALDYYNVAIELAQNTKARFNVSSVNNRVQALNKIVDKTL